MKSTLELLHFLFIHKIQYCNQMGFQASKWPIIVTNIKDLPNKSFKLSIHATMRYDKKCLGIWYPSTTKEPDLIYIDIARHKNKKQLIHTLVHELCHSRFKTGIHDKTFYDQIKCIIKGHKIT